MTAGVERGGHFVEQETGFINRVLGIGGGEGKEGGRRREEGEEEEGKKEEGGGKRAGW